MDQIITADVSNASLNSMDILVAPTVNAPLEPQTESMPLNTFTSASATLPSNDAGKPPCLGDHELRNLAVFAGVVGTLFAMFRMHN